MFRDEIVESMRQLTELRLSDLLSDEEFYGRMQAQIEAFRTARGFPKDKTAEHLSPFIPSSHSPDQPLFSVTLHSPEGEKRYEFTKREITLGRAKDSDIVLLRTDISRRHARIIVRDGRFVVLDLQSENGTHVNNQPVNSPLVVHPHDLLTLGDYQVVLEPMW